MKPLTILTLLVLLMIPITLIGIGYYDLTTAPSKITLYAITPRDQVGPPPPIFQEKIDKDFVKEIAEILRQRNPGLTVDINYTAMRHQWWPIRQVYAKIVFNQTQLTYDANIVSVVSVNPHVQGTPWREINLPITAFIKDDETSYLAAQMLIVKNLESFIRGEGPPSSTSVVAR